MRSVSLFFFLLAVCQLSAQCPNLIWSDEFEGDALNEADWNYLIGDGCDIDLCGWGNNELQWYTRENTSVADGKLAITVKRENVGGRTYTSSRITTKGKQDFKFGYLEARIKLPEGGGLWPAFWMLPTDEAYGGWPRSGEIDIMEWVGNKPDEVLGTIHYGQPWPNNSFTGHSIEQSYEEWSADYHDFAVEWDENKITWYVDGYAYGSKNRSDVSPERWPFDQDFHFLLNVAVGGSLGGTVDNSIFPAVMEVDYVRVYDTRPVTIGGARNAIPGESVAYQLYNVPANATIVWTGPEGAVITPTTANSSGVDVVFASAGGVISATITSDCGVQTVSTEVLVQPAATVEYSFENFDDEARAVYEFSNGTLAEVANPGANEVNGSALVGEYARDGGSQFDVIVYGVTTIDNATDYTDGDRSFSIDVLTQAAVGTEIILQLETAAALPNNYPTGRHSRYVARTTKQGEWERLRFEPLDQPDVAAPPTGIIKMILLFASNTNTSDTYFYDNLDSYVVGASSIAKANSLEVPFTASPNPVKDQVQLTYELPTAADHQLTLFDGVGRLLQQLPLQGQAGENRLLLNLADRPAGIYFARLQLGQKSKTIRLVKQ